MAALPQQHTGALVLAPGQLERHGKCPRLIEQAIRLEPVGQGPSQGIEESAIGQAFQLPAAPLGGTPDHLELAIAEGQHRKGALGAQQFPGLVVVGTPHLHRGCQTALAITPLPKANAQGLPGGGVGAIGRHHQIRWAGPHGSPYRSPGLPQLGGDGWMGMQPLKQHPHQGPVLGNPAQGGTFALGGTLALGKGGGQIWEGEGHRGPSAEIEQLQAPKGHHQRVAGLPKAEPLEQPPTGLGKGIGPGALLQGC